MSTLFKRILCAALAVAVIAEITVLNLQITAVRELQAQKVPAFKREYRILRSHLDELSLLRSRSGPARNTQKGVLQTSDFSRIAKEAGIPNNSLRVREWPVTSRDSDIREISNELKVYRAEAEPVFEFLRALEEVPGTNRIKTLTLMKSRGKENLFDMVVLYSTFISPSS